ncbi:hypothetical protein Patl1_09110 [Pistacia atlantica]|uniref:Uncharacterized protein n=1 Tax=Pistacia atlantica TaxID=434234 RepID=A0ACC1AH80_9ROSI|nr:hypothetical protein Patl1_09110 [Pistacia atlantica]
MQVYLNLTAIHHDPDIWGDDVNEFNPLRFSEARKHLAAFFPWGLGPRTCVGQNLAMTEAKLMLAMIIKRYTFRLSPTYVHAPMVLEIIVGFDLALPSNPRDLYVLLRPGTVFAARSDLLLANRKRNFSVVGAISRSFSVPSVSGPSFQVCGYHIDRALSDPGQLSVSSNCRNNSMAACASKAVSGELLVDFLTSKSRHLQLSPNHPGICYSIKSVDSYRRASMSLKKNEQSNNNPIHGYLMYNAAKRWRHFCPNIEAGLRGFHGSSPTCSSAGTAPDVSFDNSSHEEQLASSAASSEQKNLAGKHMKLLSGSCYLPHPDKEETGGEDAHFISDEQAVGVADGVEEPNGSIDPARVLEKAHSSTKAKGSSTACILALTDQGLRAINLGDSGFMVVRDGCTVFRSPVQQHDFNFTYQLECGSNGDLPSSGQVFTIPVAPGDVIIAGTDGLFDNLYNNEITAVVVHAVRAGLGPQVTSSKDSGLGSATSSG